MFIDKISRYKFPLYVDSVPLICRYRNKKFSRKSSDLNVILISFRRHTSHLLNSVCENIHGF